MSGQLVEQWPLKKLGDCLEIQNGHAFPSKQFDADSGMQLIRIRDLKNGITTQVKFQGEYDQKFLVTKGDLLIGMDGEFVCYEWKGEPSLLNQRVCRLQNFSSELLPRFVHYGINKYLKEIEDNTSYTTVKHLSGKNIKNINFPIPPLSIQQRIVNILDEAFEKYERATNNIEQKIKDVKELDKQLRNLAAEGRLCEPFEEKESGSRLIFRMRNILEQKIDSGEIKKPRTASLDETKPPFEVPPSWKWARLQEVTSGITDGVHKKPNYVSEGIPFITVRDMTSGPGISFQNTKFIEEEEHKEFIKRTNPEKGDILISKDGTIGVVRLIDTDIEFSIFVSVALVKPILKETSKFIALALSSQSIQKQIVPKGAALKHLYVGDLRRLWIPIPPLNEMQLITQKFEQGICDIEILNQNYCLELELLENLKNSILQEAFNGTLRITESLADQS